MTVLRVFNNNVVLAQEGAGREIILTGRGLGFQVRPGHRVDPDSAARVFASVDGLQDATRVADLLARVPWEHVHLVTEAAVDAGLKDLVLRNPALTAALADHVGCAVRRVEEGMTLEYPLLAEVKHLYAKEHTQGLALLTALNVRLPAPLPDGEAVALALHLVNAGFATGDFPATYAMTSVISQLVAVIEQTYGLRLDPGAASLGRFVTHLRYLFIRIHQHQHQRLDDQLCALTAMIKKIYPRAYECAQLLAGVVELRLGAELTIDEVAYLALHVARVATDRA